MVARRKTPDGRRVTVAARFSEPELALVESVLGDLTRSEWLRSVALAAARGEFDARLRERTGIGLVVDERMPRGTVALHSGNRPPVVITGLTDDPEPSDAPCKHPANRVDELNVCRDCGREVD